MMVKDIDLTGYIPSVDYVSVDDADINRIEVIGSDGREFVRHLKEDERLFAMLQDNNRTMKIFIDKVKE
jgi:hypothetical protein